MATISMILGELVLVATCLDCVFLFVGAGVPGVGNLIGLARGEGERKASLLVAASSLRGCE